MRIKIIILCLSFPYKIIACSCGWTDRGMEKAFQQSAFIAHVKILKKSSLEKEDSVLVIGGDSFSQYSKISIEIIELFKGSPVIKILEWGVGSSCDMGIRENEEWILFGNKLTEAFVSVNYCGYWIKMTNTLKERHWQYDGGISAMKELRTIANLPQKIIPDGAVVSFYPGGVLLAKEQFNKGKLHGTRKVYFANGLLMEESEYSNGVLIGKKDSYAKHGQSISELMYDSGEIIHSVFWYDTTWDARRMDAIFSNNPADVFPAKVQKRSEGWFDKNTGNRHSFVYYRNGVLQKEHTGLNNDSIKISKEYFESGKLKIEIHSYKDRDVTEEKRWDESGVLQSNKKWVKGKYVGDLLKQ